MLPIFLASCKTLVILPGATYASRLWCKRHYASKLPVLCALSNRWSCVAGVMEIFIFLHLSKSSEALVVYPLDDDDHLRLTFQAFAAARAECFLDSDREHLLAVVEASFGELEHFDRLMRGIFREKLLSLQERV